MNTKTQATELEYLKWFWENADFGPADDDVRMMLNEDFERETGRSLPTGYRPEAQ